MTNEMKKSITELRHNGIGYATIAAMLCISKETVKSFCRRTGLKGNRAASTPAEGMCRNCGAEIVQNPNARKKVFCSPDCRNAWWKAHPQPSVKNIAYRYICKYCGKLFTAYSTAHRKYCSHACYISDRFKGTVNETTYHTA